MTKERRFYVKVHEYEGQILLAVCDRELLGRELKKDNIVLAVPHYFYGGREVSLDEVLDLLREADIVVATGRKIIEELIKRGVITEESVLKLDNEFWHVQILREVIR